MSKMAEGLHFWYDLACLKSLVIEQEECRDVMFDHFGQRFSFLEDEIVKNLELRQNLVTSLMLPYENF